MKTLTIFLLIAASSLLAGPPTHTPSPTPLPSPSPAPASTLTYSGGIVDANCNRNGQGPVIKDSPGTVLTIHAGGLTFGANVWVLLFNKTTAPVNGDVPAIAIPFTEVSSTNSSFTSADRDYLSGLPMTTGISWALSSLPFVLSTSGACYGVTLTVTYE